MKTTTPRPILLKNYRPPSHLIAQVDLTFVLDPTATRVTSKLKVKPNPASDDKPDTLVLDGEHLELVSLKRDGKAIPADDYTVTPTSLTITGLPDAAFTLTIETIVNPDTNKSLQGLYRSSGVYCTQCEAEGFRRITYFLDRPDVLAKYTCRIEADVESAPVLLSNGNLRERGTTDSGKRHYVVWKDPHPKPSYLFALVGGNLGSVASSFETMHGDAVDLTIYVEPSKEDRCAWAMDSLKRSMVWDEKRFGRPYDLDVFNIVAVSDFNMGAMENKGLNIFNDRLILASAETATDTMFEAIESVIAHEYFHNWTGNRITCRDWFQLCLKEGLTVYRDQEFSADERSRPVQRISDVRRLRAHQFPEDAGPLAHPVRPSSYIEINNFYTATVYEKGAELVRMIATILGEDDFRKGMDLYFERHDGDAATIEDFLACFAEASGKSLDQFKLWYEQAGTPEVVVKLNYDKAKRRAELVCEQSQRPTAESNRKKPLHIPLAIGLLGPDGEDMPLTLTNGETVDDGVLHLTKASQTFKFKDVDAKPVLSALRGFSAPVVLKADWTERQLAFLMANDPDDFARWQAASDYATKLLLSQVKAGSDLSPNADRAAAFADALSQAIGNEDLEPAYRAELLRLPTEQDLARESARAVDPARIHEARGAVLTFIGKRLGRQLARLYDSLEINEAYAPTPDQVGKRALRNAALALLVRRNSKSDRERLQAHFDAATNMTDQAAALMLFAHSNMRGRTAVLERFYDQWQDDHLVMDTWFAAQATAPQPATLTRVKRLLKDPRFSATNPNKIRALIGSFAMQNPVQFARPDGAGFRFVTGEVVKIDRFNPQIAARLLGAFRSWRQFEPGRRKHAKDALRDLAAAPDLSRDVYEIAKRILD
jgi:aminopeptidase N